MSKYDSYSVPAVRELLEELCPDGVPLAPLRRVAHIHRGKRVTKAQLLDDGQYPVMSGGTTPMGYLDRANQRPNITTVVKYGSAGFVNFITEEFWANDVCYCLQPLDSTTDRYLYHVLKSRQNDLFELRTNAVPPPLTNRRYQRVRGPNTSSRCPGKDRRYSRHVHGSRYEPES